MAAPEIIGSSRSTYTRAVCMVCEEKGIEYVPTEKPLHAPEIHAIHPFGKMPVLRHGDLELFESKAIATYLDRSFPAPFVFPSEPRLAALTEQWVSLVNTVIDRTIIRTYLFAFIAPGTPTESLIGRRSEPSCRWCASRSRCSTRRSPRAAIWSAIG
jgi:glutathione S-transferase